METTKIILDRLYSFPFLSSLERNSDKSLYTSLDNREHNSNIFSAINSAALLYDKILIEDTLGTSMKNIFHGNKLHPFWKIFEIFCFDQTIYENNDELLYSESIKSDLKDRKLKVLLKNYYKAKGQKANVESLIYYLNKLVLQAKAQNAHILSFPARYQLLEYKFEKSSETINYYNRGRSILEKMIEIKIPDFDYFDIAMIVKIREDKRLVRLRELISDLIKKFTLNISIEKQLNDEFLNIQDEIITTFKPKKSKMIIGYISSALPFPLDQVAQVRFDLEDLKALKKYSWYFLLDDIKNIKHDEHYKGKY